MDEWMERMERLSAAAAALERVAEQMAERQVALAAEAEQSVDRSIGRIVATVESQRECELSERLRIAEEKLVAAEERIAELTAAAAVKAEGRKTIAAGATAMLSKGGGSAGMETGRIEAGALDAALSSLSIEQRFAVKAEMLRSGLL